MPLTRAKCRLLGGLFHYMVVMTGQKVSVVFICCHARILWHVDNYMFYKNTIVLNISKEQKLRLSTLQLKTVYLVYSRGIWFKLRFLMQ